MARVRGVRQLPRAQRLEEGPKLDVVNEARQRVELRLRHRAPVQDLLDAAPRLPHVERQPGVRLLRRAGQAFIDAGRVATRYAPYVVLFLVCDEGIAFELVD